MTRFHDRGHRRTRGNRETAQNDMLMQLHHSCWKIVAENRARQHAGGADLRLGQRILEHVIGTAFRISDSDQRDGRHASHPRIFFMKDRNVMQSAACPLGPQYALCFALNLAVAFGDLPYHLSTERP
jgi:hypothetical protein